MSSFGAGVNSYDSGSGSPSRPLPHTSQPCPPPRGRCAPPASLHARGLPLRERGGSAASPGRRIRGQPGTASRGPRLIYPPSAVSMAPPRSLQRPGPRAEPGAAAAGGERGSRASSPSPGVGARAHPHRHPDSCLPGSCATSAAPAQPPSRGPAPGAVPSPPPRAPSAPSPDRRRGGGAHGAGKVAELLRTLRSCSCEGSFPPPSWTRRLGTRTHPPPPATCLAPAAPGRTESIPGPCPRGAQVYSRVGPGAAGEWRAHPPSPLRPGGEGTTWSWGGRRGGEVLSGPRRFCTLQS